jgi:sortase A
MTKSRKKRKSRARRWMEHALLLAGVAGLGVWVWSTAGRAVFQDWQSWVFDRQLRGERASFGEYLNERGQRMAGHLPWLKLPAAPEPSVPRPIVPSERPAGIPNNGLIGRLAIPRLHLSTMVREGVGEETLSLAAGHIPGTAMPGNSGNVGVAGHRDTLFRSLRNIHENDVIRFETLSGNYLYQVEATQIVKPQDVSVLKAGQHAELTLVTCYPFYFVGSAPDRFIVKARQVSGPSPKETAQPHDPVVAAAPASVVSRPPAASVVSRPPAANKSSPRRIPFAVSRNHSRQLAPGISLGLTETDVIRHRVSAWVWLTADRRTIWLRDRRVREPVIFYGNADGRKRTLVITSVARNSMTGYLVLRERPTAKD